jgi:anaphase-promoting complex subunit 3
MKVIIMPSRLENSGSPGVCFYCLLLQVDPTFVYAYTLLGHEYVTTEELDKAMSCFRSAVRIDARHYNAW